jgi:hypothetical protein
VVRQRRLGWEGQPRKETLGSKKDGGVDSDGRCVSQG